MIPLIPKFTKAEITKRMQLVRKRIRDAILMRLKRVGETFVRNARENGSYNDITGNLRNSIGYLILENGVQISLNFARTATVNRGGKAGKGSGDGLNVGKSLALEIGAKYPTGYVLIVVAGMEYAAAVESRGKEVLTGSSQIAISELKDAMRNLDNKIGKLVA